MRTRSQFGTQPIRSCRRARTARPCRAAHVDVGRATALAFTPSGVKARPTSYATPLDLLCDRLIHELGTAHDDVALLAVRLTP